MTEEEKAELQNMVTVAAQATEGRLIATFGTIIEGLNKKVDLNEKAASELETKAKTAFESLPAVIHSQVENQLGVLVKQFEERQKGPGNGGESGGGGGGFGMRELLGHAPQIVEVINAWKQPGTEAQMMSQMNLIFRWHGLLSKLEKGGGSGQDVTQAIADTFKTQDQE